MADICTSTHSTDRPIAAATPLAGLGLGQDRTAPGTAPRTANDPAPDPAVAAYHRLRAAAVARPYDGSTVASAEDVLIATRATSPAGVGAKLVELAGHQGWFAQPEQYETRLIHSALADLKGLEGRS